MNHKSLTRRDFLRTSAIAAGSVVLPYFVPARALGAGGASPSEKIVIGYRGTFSMGSGHVKAFTGKSDVQAVAVCDVNRSGNNYAGNRLGEIVTRLNRPPKCDLKRWRFPEDHETQGLVKRQMRGPWVP